MSILIKNTSYHIYCNILSYCSAVLIVPWNWTDEYQSSFEKMKNALTSTEVLSHYNPNLSLALACDASSVGVGAVLFHTNPDGSEQPITCATKNL